MKFLTTSFMVLSALFITGCTQIDTPVNANRYYNLSANVQKGAQNANVAGNAFEEKVNTTQNNGFFNGSFYATVKHIEMNPNFGLATSQVQGSNVGQYKVYLEGERGTEVSLTTSKLVQIGEKVLFVYNQDFGEIITQNEPQYHNIVPQQRNPK